MSKHIEEKTSFGSFILYLLKTVFTLGIYHAYWSWSRREKSVLLLEEMHEKTGSKS